MPLSSWLRGAALFLAGLALGFSARRPAPPPPAAALPVPSCPPVAAPSPVPSALASAPASALLLRRAEEGDRAALKELDRRTEVERGAEGSEALARGHAALARLDLAALEEAIGARPALARDRSTLARLHTLLEHEPIQLDVVAALGRLPGPDAQDLLHATWRRHGPGTVGLLARDLLRQPEALRSASEALRLAIELEQLLEERPERASQRARRCERAAALLERARTQGDKRLAPSLVSLERPGGCGGGGQEDCFSCLRAGAALREIREQIQKRDAPTPWILSRR
jgi:hypothetical protein